MVLIIFRPYFQYMEGKSLVQHSGVLHDVKLGASGKKVGAWVNAVGACVEDQSLRVRVWEGRRNFRN